MRVLLLWVHGVIVVLSNECITIYKKKREIKIAKIKKNEHLADAYEYVRVKQKINILTNDQNRSRDAACLSRY